MPRAVYLSAELHLIHRPPPRRTLYAGLLCSAGGQVLAADAVRDGLQGTGDGSGGRDEDGYEGI